jgi:RNA polymerase sigma-70 factor (ECF subfamily)
MEHHLPPKPEAEMIEDADWLYERLLVLRCQAGDQAAFAALVNRYQPRLRYYVKKMLCGLREPDDVLQEIWLDVFRAISRLLDPDAFRAWLYQVARTRTIKEFRKRRLTFESLEPNEPVDAEQAAEIFGVEDVKSVHTALDSLGAAHREVLVLRYIEGMSYEEIARIVKCEIGTVRSRLHYAKRGLRSEIEKGTAHER